MSKPDCILSKQGTRLMLDGERFYFQGLSFFNALYNVNFNRDEAERVRWLRVFKDNGISALRIWCQWDFGADRQFIDVSPENTMYAESGRIREKHFQTLCSILDAVRDLTMIIELTLFSHERQPNLPVPAQERAARSMAERLLPYRHLILQIWNEDSTEVRRYFEAIKAVDPSRIVTNSPGFSDDLGDEEQNQMLDLLTPHTVRRGVDRFWEEAPSQISSLLEKYQKPVIDDEPARTGIVRYGGIEVGTIPDQHVEQIQRVRAAGGYHTYHHDMFQSPYGSPATPQTGVPEPDFNPFHRQVFDYLRDNPVW